MKKILGGVLLGFLFFDKRGKTIVNKVGSVADKGLNTVLDNSKKMIVESMPVTSKLLKIEKEDTVSDGVENGKIQEQ